MNGFTNVVVLLLVLSTVPPSPGSTSWSACAPTRTRHLRSIQPRLSGATRELSRLRKTGSETSFRSFRAMVRTRWTEKNIYFLFVSPYDELHLKPNPTNAKGNQRTLELGCRGSFHRLRLQ